MSEETYTVYGGKRSGGKIADKIAFLTEMLVVKDETIKKSREEVMQWKSAALCYLERLAQHRWIPASDPPKKDGRYLTFCENIKTPQIRLYEGEWDSIQKVTHWMPLPEPPKED